MDKECKDREVQPESQQQVHWLEDGDGFLADVHWSGSKFPSSLNQVLMGNQSLTS